MKQEKTKAILVDVIDLETSKTESMKRLEEMENLVNTYGGIVVVKTIQKKDTPNYNTYVGKGKLEEIFEIAKGKKVELIILNNILKPRQIFNLEEFFRKADVKTKVWDRVDTILKIFDKHAQSTEAKLQIELASIEHMGPRIFGMGIELSRQPGAMGLRGGPGEANIEIMKRHLQKQKLNILKKLKHYEAINEGHRKQRRRKNFKTAAIVGYTNSGKSTLLNALTKKGVYVADKLFATLDTRVGNLYIPPNQSVLVSDTIGFIQDLPPSLIQAFKSTLAETIESDLILHVIDVADPQIHKKIEVVEEILDKLGLKNKPKIYIFNKIDLIDSRRIVKKLSSKPQKNSILQAGPDTAKILGWTTKEKQQQERQKGAVHNPDLLKRKYKKFYPVFVSAENKVNLKELVEKIKEKI